MSFRVMEMEVEVGILEKETVHAVLMTRELFLEVVGDTLADEDAECNSFESIRHLIWPIALEIEFFPFSTWIAPGRGCGCLVGEYLMRNDLIDREWAASQRERDIDITQWFGEVGYTELMMAFGNLIDRRLAYVCDRESMWVGGELWKRVLVIMDKLPDEDES